MASEIQQFFRDHGISEVEAIIPDMAGVARGKIMPAAKFAEDEGMRLPESIFLQTVTGDYPPNTGDAMSPAEIDIVLKADPKTVRRVPWAAEPTAQVIHDCFYSDGRRVTMAPRHVLRNVLELYAQRGWEPVVAPELEFYLIEPNIDADYPLKPPIGRSGRAEPGRQSYSIAAVNEFDPLFDDIYQFCEDQDIEILSTATPWTSLIRLFCSSVRRARRRCDTRCTRRSWPNRMLRSRVAPCTFTRVSSI
jgi:glutamine synthetase